MASKLQSAANRLAALTGWRRRGAAFGFGVLATLTLPPFFIFPLIFPAFAGLYILLSNAGSSRRAFWDGWWWGWGYYITGLYWFCIALLTDAEKFAWLIPFALFGLTAVIAIYPGVACLITSRLRARPLAKIVLFSAVWTVVELARGHWFSGFPWNLPAYSFMFSDITLQSASLVGAYGLSWFVVLLGVTPAAFVLPGIEARHVKYFSASVAALFLAVTVWGAWRLHVADQLPEEQKYVAGVKLRLVQADIAQPHKWDPRKQILGLREYIRLTGEPGIENITHVIWPETAVPYVTQPGSELTRILGGAIPKGAHLITGTLRAQGEGAAWQVWNSLITLDHKGDIVGGYDKSKLVPFGEFLPFRSFLPKKWLTPVGDTDFSSGPGMETLHWPGLPGISPLICYEVIFPERATSETDRPAWLLSVTNDAWFGQSSGPYQHFNMARMRAVEQGLPLIRVANTGITASVDEFGRVHEMMGLGEKGIIDLQLRKSQLSATAYSEHKNLFVLLLVLTSLLLTISEYKRKK